MRDAVAVGIAVVIEAMLFAAALYLLLLFG